VKVAYFPTDNMIADFFTNPCRTQHSGKFRTLYFICLLTSTVGADRIGWNKEIK